MLIKCYTDGSACVRGPNKGKGGFATYFPNLFGKKKVFHLGFTNTKTGRMEITALLYAIRAIPLNFNCTLKVYSDSEYVVKSFTENRLNKWVQNNWISYGSEIKNVDLWKKVIFELKGRPSMNIILQHIKSHKLDKEKCLEKRKILLSNQDIIGNAIADKYADYKRFNKFKNDLKQ